MKRTGKRRFRLWQIIALALLGSAILGGGIFALVLSLTGPVTTAADNFMTALKGSDYPSAFEMGTADLRQELGSPQRLGGMFEQARPATWSWSTRSMRNGTGSVTGSVTYSTGSQGDVTIFLLPEGDDWKVSGFRMNPR